MHVALDHILVVLIAVAGPIADCLWLYPRLARNSAVNDPTARPLAYGSLMAFAWGATACVAGLWLAHRRPWSALLLAGFHPLRLGIGLAVAVAYAALAVAQSRAIAKRPQILERVGRKLGKAEPLMPRTPAERQAFMAVALTAGICEEFLYRGYLTWYFSLWTGLIPAKVIATLLFGLAHMYLGRTHVVQSTIAGAVLAVLAAASGSLLPAIVMHAIMDLVAGHVGSRAMRARP